MKKYEIGLSISVLLIFTLTMIVIFTGVFIDFFSIDDHTIIAALIGVVGAVIGGVISGGLTLWGVKLTFLENREKEKEKELPKKLENAEQLEQHLISLRTKIKSVSRFSETERMEFKNFILEKKLVDLSINLNEAIYHKIKKIEMTTYNVNELEKIFLTKLDRTIVNEAIELVKEEKEKLLKKIFP